MAIDDYPETVRRSDIAQIRRANAEHYLHGAHWSEADPKDFPTRPADAELLPCGHLHSDGHYCDSHACANSAGLREHMCMACQLSERDRSAPSRGMNK